MVEQSTQNTSSELIATFWQSSCKFYQFGQVKNRLLKLQDQGGYSINRLLFSIWFSQFFQKIIVISLLDSNIKTLNQAELSIISIRDTRRELRNSDGKNYSVNIEKARKHLLESELYLEKEIQSLLVTALCQGVSMTETIIPTENLTLLIEKNIHILCTDVIEVKESTICHLSKLWIQHQGCYN